MCMVATMANMPTINDGRRAATLREHRRARGLSQEQLGDLVGLGNTAVSRIESGARAMTRRNRMQFEAALRALPVLHVDGDITVEAA
jgi:transcriptional regulator with XRE-family HTH domain